MFEKYFPIKKKNESSDRTEWMHCYRNQNRLQKVFEHFKKLLLTYGHRGKKADLCFEIHERLLLAI